MNIFSYKRHLYRNEDGDGGAGGSMGSGDNAGNTGSEGKPGESNQSNAAAGLGASAEGRGENSGYGFGRDDGGGGSSPDQSQAETNRLGLNPNQEASTGLVNITGDLTDRNAFGRFMDRIPAGMAAKFGLPGIAATLANKLGMGDKSFGIAGSAAGIGDGSRGERGEPNGGGGGSDTGIAAATAPFGAQAPAQTTAASTGDRAYVWDPATRTYTLSNLGAQANPMQYTQGQQFQMAKGGAVEAGIAAGAPLQSRYIKGEGDGLSDDVPVKMDDGQHGRLADGEFVIAADVVSGLGNGSSEAGAKLLYAMMDRIRQKAHGKTQQTRPVDPEQVLPA